MAKETGKKEVKKKKQKGRWTLYETASGLKRKNSLCPKCNNFLAAHQDRHVCGKCGYMESLKK